MKKNETIAYKIKEDGIMKLYGINSEIRHGFQTLM